MGNINRLKISRTLRFNNGEFVIHDVPHIISVSSVHPEGELIRKGSVELKLSKIYNYMVNNGINVIDYKEANSNIK